jgi:hypothetical protein
MLLAILHICTLSKKNITLGTRRKQAVRAASPLHPLRVVCAAAVVGLLAPVAAVTEHCGKIPFEIPILAGGSGQGAGASG